MVIASTTHDTASAVAAIPRRDIAARISAVAPGAGGRRDVDTHSDRAGTPAQLHQRGRCVVEPFVFLRT
jgi:hypothetical protein